MGEGLAAFLLQPAFVLSLLVGAFHASAYVFITGRLGWHLPAVLLGAILGAFVGQALGARIGDVLSIGDYSLIWASVLAWMGIGIALVTSSLVGRQAEPDEPPPGGQVRPRQ